ncbi:MAG: ATP-dependent RecD-like DNA helicase [Desulfovibrio sp.]|jgi:exodeoxyribonuclease V alpha subunit|nr:ATP-dependent RecD-like DNA helicase [Desulfovibrio sp.]
MGVLQSLLDPDVRHTLRGTLERVVFHNEENGYTVLRLRVQNRAEPVTVVGSMPVPQPGIGMSVTGIWVNDERFGRQFKMESFEALLPATAEGIRLYLGSGLIKGVGKTLAGRIVDAFGEETFTVLDDDPDRLTTVKGISPRLVSDIKAAWAEHKGIRDLIMFLQPHGVSTSYAVRIFRHYGVASLAVVRENPYRLAMDIHGIGFITADTVAMKLGIAPDSPLRAEAGLLYVLKRITEEGHVFFPYEKLVRQTAGELGIEEEIIRSAVSSLALEERIVLEDLTDDQDSVFQAVYLGRFHHYECNIAHYLRRILRSPKAVHFEEPETLLRGVLNMLPLSLAEEQVEAARASLSGKVMVITGGPGTGKTTLINAVIKLFEMKKAKILLAAPTGRAAKRMAETSGREAKTIHRLLEYSPKEDGFARNEDHPLACGLLVVDEASMLDTMLLYHLLKAVPLGATLVFVGDVNQLPSVGPGNVLKDIIASGTVEVIRLTEVFRQAAASEIIVNAHRVNQGEMPELTSPERGLSDFYFIRQEDPDKVADMVVELVRDHIPRRFRLDPLDDIQVLTPMHKGAAGVSVLNQRLQAALNPRNIGIQRGERRFRLDDKVMQLRNNYDKDVFNGDMGRICYISEEEREITVRYDDRNVLYGADDLDEIIPAYAISVHKSQGSEYPAVVLPVLTQHYMLLQRNLIYTGITRGKKLVVLIGSLRALHIAVNNNKMHARYTWLHKRLSRGIV